MPVFICDSEDQLLKQVPGTFSELRVADLHIGNKTETKYIRGYVKWCGQLSRIRHRSVIKIIIEQDGISLPVFFAEKYAEDLQTASVGDLLVLSGVVIESNCRPGQKQSACQVVVDPSLSAADIWILHKPGRKGESRCETDAASTSAVSGDKQSSGAMRSYQYTKLAEIKVGHTVNIFGVVKYVKPPSKTRGSDYSFFVSIVDDSCTVKLKCLIFARTEQSLPPIEKSGEIIRFHRLKIQEFNGQLQGQGNCSHGFSCLVFSGEVGGSLTPRSVSATYTCTDQDLNRVRELRQWLNYEDVLSQPSSSVTDEVSSCSRSTLKDCCAGQFFDLTCQVVGTCVLTQKSMLLKVWDGTNTTFAVKKEDLTDLQYFDWLHVDESLLSEAGHLVVDIYIFDDQVGKASSVKPGDFIILKNLHAALYQNKNPTTSFIMRPVELIMHGGGASYGRDIKILHEMDPEVIRLKQQLADAVSCNVSVTSQRDPDTPSVTQQQQEISENPLQRHSGICDTENTTSSYDSENRCMLNTATVITANHHQLSSTIKEVIRHPAPHKFRLLCRVKDLLPKPDEPHDLIKLYCVRCHYVGCLPAVNTSNTTTLAPIFYKKEQLLDLYACPKCPGSPADRCLEYTLMLQLLLHDNTGWIVAGIWREEAERFFNDTTAASVLLKSESFQYVKMHLSGLIESNSQFGSDHSPLIECCVKSYVAAGGVCYQIFDTCLTELDTDT